MDSQVQWRSLQQSDQRSTKVPKLHHLVDHQQSPASSALALFAHEPNINKATINPPSLSAFQDSTPTRYPMVGGYFSLAQWQELELQALIYKYMLAGAPVPLELILPIRRSLLTASPYYHHQQYQHLQPAMLQAGYWGRCVIDPEPGRCRRTDGKKWRCSREVVTGQKYCERHVHRGRDRSRKHVEIPTPTAASCLKPTLPSPLATTKEPHFTLSGPSPTLEILPLGQRHPDGKTANGYLPQGYCSKFSSTQELQGDKSDNRVLRKFLDDWPRTQQELTPGNGNASSAASTTHLSISIPGNSSSDFSLKLSTGNGDKPGPGGNKDGGDGRMPPPPANWSAWGSHGEASMGGPLAEVLRSSTSTPSPTSVLQKPHGSVSETSSTST